MKTRRCGDGDGRPAFLPVPTCRFLEPVKKEKEG
jgi:hypothetical protein